ALTHPAGSRGRLCSRRERPTAVVVPVGAAARPRGTGVSRPSEPSLALDTAIPYLYDAVYAGAYTAVLFLAGIFGERPKSGKEVILATQRALEQQALERWQLQKAAQIEQMMRDGVPLGAVAAALASPETAERIALMEAATSGGLSPLEAARLNLRRAGQDATVLDGLLAAPTPTGGNPH